MFKKSKAAKTRNQLVEKVKHSRDQRDVEKRAAFEKAQTASSGDAKATAPAPKPVVTAKESLQWITVNQFLIGIFDGEYKIHAIDVFFCLKNRLKWSTPIQLMKDIKQLCELKKDAAGKVSDIFAQRLLAILLFWIRHSVDDFRGKKNAELRDGLHSLFDLLETVGLENGVQQLKLDIIKAARLKAPGSFDTEIHLWNGQTHNIWKPRKRGKKTKEESGEAAQKGFVTDSAMRKTLYSHKILKQATHSRFKHETMNTNEEFEDLGKLGQEELAIMRKYEREIPDELLGQIWLQPVKKKLGKDEWKKTAPKEKPAVGVGYFRKAHSPNPALKGTSPFRGVKLATKGAVLYQVGKMVVLFKRPLFVVAAQLMYYEWNVFRDVDTVELMKTAWKNEGAEKAAPNAFWLVENFNRIAADMNNFNCVQEILAGLNCMSVERMKKTWAALPSSSTQSFKSLQELMDSTNNYENYRTALSLCSGKPTLPYMGTYFRDIVYIEDGNPDKPEDKAPLINIKKVKMLSGNSEHVFNLKTTQKKISC